MLIVNTCVSSIRDRAVDNAKLVLVFLVVLGHMLEPILLAEGVSLYMNALYSWIYVFHMPAFVMVSGYLAAKSTSKDFGKSILVPLFVFVVMYEVFNYLLYGTFSVYLAMLMPYWLMWYLLSLFMWRAFVVRYGVSLLLFGVALLVSLLYGFLGGVGNLFGLSRTVYFFPFFIFGYAIASGLFPRLSFRPSVFSLLVFVFVSVSLLMGYLLFAGDLFSSFCASGGLLHEHCLFRLSSFLYGTKGYYYLADSIFILMLVRVVLYVLSFVLAYTFLRGIFSLRLPFGFVGKNTLHVFLWHGFFVKLLVALGWFSLLSGLVWYFAFTIVVILSVLLTWLLLKDCVAIATDRYLFEPFRRRF